jgi:hypothetical protein
MKRIILIILSVIAVLFPLSMLTYSIIFSDYEDEDIDNVIENNVKAITCSNIQLDNFNSKIDFSGKVVSANKIPISSEVTGVFSSLLENKFKVGQKFKKGEVLIKIDCTDLEFQLRSGKIEFKQLLLKVLPDLKSDFESSYSEWYNYINNFSIEGALLEHPKSESDKQSNFLASRGILSSFVELQRIQNQFNKSIIIAPFDGVVTQSFLSSGMNIVPYQKLGEFMDEKNFEITSSFSLDESNFLNIGDQAMIYYDDLNYYSPISDDFSIELVRKGNHVNALTQGIDVAFKVEHSSLMDGMFVNGSIDIDLEGQVVKIHKEKLIDKKYVFIQSSRLIKKKEVNIIFSENDSVVITGLNKSDCLIDDYQNYFFDGMSID